MYLNIPSLVTVLGLAAMASADSMAVSSNCNLYGYCRRSGQFTTANGVYSVDAAEGCRSTSVPGMIEFCVDWGRNRAHFKFQGWTGKSCLAVSSHKVLNCGPTAYCAYTEFTPVKCSW
ncbi:hypothetical protein C8A00DRAFT_38410 [Chaetomidium leptoderma]|uniref:Secreted protein n=1 Tax=Chaetomidium leptoderma TaxID=669021 RepID=A0AAN6VEF5_9PEZI|nr:hypothetical protein C8A00DRAFT_38410 [Chaetomidium leptoderma]